MMKLNVVIWLVVGLVLSATAAMAGDGSYNATQGTQQPLIVFDTTTALIGGVTHNIPKHTFCDPTTTTQCAAVDASGNISTNVNNLQNLGAALSTSSASVVGATDQFGTSADAPCSSDTGNCTFFALFKRWNQLANSAVQVNTNNVGTALHVCGAVAFAHITTATTTQVVPASGTQTIYVCDYSFSFGGTGNAQLVKSSTGTCGSPTAIDQTWYGAVNVGKSASNPYYRGLNTGASGQLCVTTSAAVPFDIAVYYDRY